MTGKHAQQPKFIVLGNRNTSGKPSWTIYARGQETTYNELVARVYSEEWADTIVQILNEAIED